VEEMFEGERKVTALLSTPRTGGMRGRLTVRIACQLNETCFSFPGNDSLDGKHGMSKTD
jgi:hypothetical protein